MKAHKVIFAKAGWCGHCQFFTPIFNEVSKRKIDEYSNIKFESYDLENKDETEKKNFIASYPELINKIQYYPTIFLLIEDVDNKVISGTINHVTSKTTHKKDIDEASNLFINNIINGFKSLESNGKKIFVETSTQQGGSKCCSIEKTINNSKYVNDTDYKLKYIKYKSKYMQLKKN